MRTQTTSRKAIAFPILRSRIPRLAAIVLLAVAWSNPALCDEIHKAAQKGDVVRVGALLTGNPNLVSRRDLNGMTPLQWAALEGRTNVVELLLTHGSEVGAGNNDGMTPLHWAASEGHKDVVRLLLAHEAKVNARDRFGMTPLHRAANQGHRDVVRLLLANKAEINT